MTDQLQAARDEIAEMCGWKRVDYIDDPPGIVRTAWCHELSEVLDHHPIPACLNFVSRVWPDGWDWVRDVNEDGAYRWVSFGTHAGIVSISTMDSDELTDRMTLLLKVLHWLRDNDRPAFGAACEKIRKECGQ